ncbi:AfsR/SARP family transcriptional regulator [Streptomyces monashensis]|uniref:OmpR/PhoB-type domain-containing protein n=1 Tax=Streptomyces monashensis TaxID=1678012 RepID=A0A1S2PSE8_9ACTN|nr:AfsR/SARP family transcriptional regulator [Streptomyces monashensis]OIJ96315.1 hypothetical protein BIV23_32695 [Streptomyces monashensis]
MEPLEIPASTIFLRLLGPFELEFGEQSVNPGGPRQRAVLAMLAINAGRLTPLCHLVDAVWGEDPPATARGQIQFCVSSLRKVFHRLGHAGAIRTDPVGYALEVASDGIDRDVFLRKVSQARDGVAAGESERAADLLREALALWRGPALLGLPSPILQRAATELDEHRIRVVQERIRLDLDLGQHDRVTAELRGLVEEHPLAEPFHVLLMLALYRSGRQADALEVARRARSVLLEELGVDPGCELQTLERAILNHDASLDFVASHTAAPLVSSVARAVPPASASAFGGAQSVGPAAASVPEPCLSQDEQARDEGAAPRHLPASLGDFSGRESQVEAIKSIVVSARQSPHSRYTVPIVAVSGPGGVGKTALAVRVAHELAELFPDGHLYADMQATQDQQPVANVASRFLFALGVRGEALPDEPQERLALLRSQLAERQVLIVLDDVALERHVKALLPGGAGCAVIITSRVRLSGLDGAHQIDLDVFDDEQSREMIRRIVGRDRVAEDPAATSELLQLCGGLPLALRIAGARLAARPHWPVSKFVRRLSNEARCLDEFSHNGVELRSSISMTYDGLDSAARLLFRRCALIRSADFPAWIAAALLDTDIVEAEDLLEQLVDARLIDTVHCADQPVSRYRLHSLLRVYAWEQLVKNESAAEYGEALERVVGGWLLLAERVHRVQHGGDFLVLRGTGRRWLPPGTTSQDIGSFGTGLFDEEPSKLDVESHWLVDAVRQTARSGLDELCWDLALTAVTLFELGGHVDDWRETAQLALAATERSGNRRGEAAMRYSMGTLRMFQKRLAEADEWYGTALGLFREIGDDHGVALVLRYAAHIAWMQDRHAEMLAKYHEALSLMCSVGDRIGEAHILCALARAALAEEDFASAEPMLRTALEIAQQFDSPQIEAQARFSLSDLHCVFGDVDSTRHELNRVLRIVRGYGDQIGEAYSLQGLARLKRTLGEHDAARQILLNALEIAQHNADPWIEAIVLFDLGILEAENGKADVAVQRLAGAQVLFRQIGSASWSSRANAAIVSIIDVGPVSSAARYAVIR